MKKTLIAGAGVAAFAMAALPFTGVFATQAEDPAEITDTLTVNVNGTCTFTRSNGTGAYTQTMAANALNSSFGTSTFTSGCNNGTGYAVTADFTDLEHETGDGTAIEYDDQTPVAGSGSWVAYSSTDSTNIGNNGTAFETNAADPAGGSSFTVVYKVATHPVQAQGSYEGTATYTLAQKAAS